jgi:hypothetical protein
MTDLLYKMLHDHVRYASRQFAVVIVKNIRDHDAAQVVCETRTLARTCITRHFQAPSTRNLRDEPN